jgi:hypothetical protein
MLLSLLLLPLLPDPQNPAPACRPGDYSPAGVMDVRCAMEGAWMLNLRSDYTRFQGLRDKSQRITTEDALAQGYTQVPVSMDMTMIMLEAMTSPSDSLSLRASLPWMKNTMRMQTNLGQSFDMDSSGIGDLSLGADVVAWTHGEQSVSTGLALSVPTGSVTETGGMPGTPPTKLEYIMQLGSGTFDLTPRIDWRMRAEPYVYGAELSGTVRTGHNSEDYALGDRFDANAWAKQEWSSTWAGSVRLSATRVGNVRGADPDLDPMMSPTNDPKKQAYERVVGAIGVDWLPFEGKLSGSVVGLELGVPLSQHVDGPQLSEDWFASLRIGISF